MFKKAAKIINHPHFKEGIKSYTIGFFAGLAGHYQGNKSAQKNDKEEQEGKKDTSKSRQNTDSPKM